jgi:uncharacterized protein (DUF885 family)
MKWTTTLLVLACLALQSGNIFAQSDAGGRRAQLNKLLAEDWEYQLKTNPEMATHTGDHRYNEILTDYSLQAVEATFAHDKETLSRIEAIDTTGFPEQEQLNKELMVRSLRESIEGFKFKNWEMPVSQLDGIHQTLAELVSDTPFSSVKDYENYLARLHQIPRVFDQVTTNMRQGMKDHLMQPKYLLEKVAVQAQTIADDSMEASPFTQPVLKFPVAIPETDQVRLRAAILAVVKTEVAPAYAKFAAFVRDEYAPKGRTELGIWALPDGDARYRFAIRDMTTTDLTPEQIHQIGQKNVIELESEMLKIAHGQGYNDLKSFNDHIRTDRKLYAASGDQLMDLYQHYTDQMYERLPQLFGKIPKNKLAVVPMEAYRQPDAVPADYSIGAGDNSRPGRINVNEYAPQKRLLLNVEAIAYHEGIPGHHLQFSLAQELPDLLPFRKYGLYYNAYSEGWAFYAERLGKDVGFYQDPYSDYGRLENEMWRSVRLVVDTGVHYKHWTREQMVDFFHQHTAMDEPNIQTEVDRYIAWPAQALSYKIGQMKILELRERAKNALGEKFDIRSFHDAVLNTGALPLDVLEEKINRWIAAQQNHGSN